jgi:hypothetical protein
MVCKEVTKHYSKPYYVYGQFFFCIILGLELSEFKQVQNNYVSDKLIFLTFETDQFLFLAM